MRLILMEGIAKVMNLADIRQLEHVTVQFNIEHSCRGDLTISLQSPAGTIISLATRRPLDQSAHGLYGITMMTVGFWGEHILGSWTLKVANAPKTKGHGKLIDYRIIFWGSLADGRVESDED